jgi:uncharacterized protein (DUF433 family)
MNPASNRILKITAQIIIALPLLSALAGLVLGDNDPCECANQCSDESVEPAPAPGPTNNPHDARTHGPKMVFSLRAAGSGSLQEIGMTQFDRITLDPAVMGGKPCVRGMRVTVGMIVGQIGTGRTIEEVLSDYPYLDREDVLQALRYAAWLAEDREVSLPRA